MGMTFELKFRIRPVPVLVAIFVLARLNTGEGTTEYAMKYNAL